MFLCLATIRGMMTREAHQFLMLLSIIILFSFIVKNIWLTGFLIWSTFLFIFFKFNLGHIYLQNVFLGGVLYYLTKLAFKKEHINFVLNMILWLVAVNLFYGIIQILNLDFLWDQTKLYETIRPIFGLSQERYYGDVLKGFYFGYAPIGFMGNTGFTALLYAFALPILFTRKGWLAKVGGGLLFLVILYLHSTIAMVSSVIALLFIGWFYLNRKILTGFILLSMIFGVMYFYTIDKPGVERFSMWKLTMQDSLIHPITGWGMDSFRNYSEKKNHIYVNNVKQVVEGGKEIDVWDNPHNLYVSLFFEFGVVGIFLLGGYLRRLAISFLKAIKSPNTIALTGILLIFFIASGGTIIIFLARLAVIVIPCFALLETEMG